MRPGEINCARVTVTEKFKLYSLHGDRYARVIEKESPDVEPAGYRLKSEFYRGHWTVVSRVISVSSIFFFLPPLYILSASTCPRERFLPLRSGKTLMSRIFPVLARTSAISVPFYFPGSVFIFGKTMAERRGRKIYFRGARSRDVITRTSGSCNEIFQRTRVKRGTY